MITRLSVLLRQVLTTHESWHLLLVRWLVYAIALVLLLSPRATSPAIAASIAAALIGIRAADAIAASRMRLIAVLSGSLVTMVLGLTAQALLGRCTSLAILLGPTAIAYSLNILFWGTSTLVAVLLLRTCASRWPVCSLGETAAVLASVVQVFAGHRNWHLGQPRFFSDWSFAAGHDPVQVLMAIGLILMCGLLILQQRQQTVAKTVQAFAMLALVLGLGISCMPAGWIEAVLQKPGGAGGGASSENDTPRHKSDKPSTPIAVVELHDDCRPYEGQWYFRQSVRSVFNGQLLVRSSGADMDQDVPGEFPTAATTVPHPVPARDIHQEVSASVHLIDDVNRPLCLVGPTSLEPCDNPSPTDFRRSYRVRSRMLVGPLVNGARQDLLITLWWSQAGNSAWTPAIREQYLKLPNDPRYSELAQQIVSAGIAADKQAHATSPIVVAMLFRKWIEDNITYSQSVDDSAPDFAARFLFETHKGYCIHIAHSLVYLFRARGIPARVAQGYMVGQERNGDASTIVVMNDDGHAWPEIYLEGAGWVVMDAFAKKHDPNERTPQEPDAATKQTLADKVRRPDQFAPPPTGPLAASRQTVRGGLSAMFLVALVALYSVKWWRRLAPQYADKTHLPRTCYRAVLDRLSEYGWRRRFGETREQFAARINAAVPEFSQLSAAHLQATVGSDRVRTRAMWLEMMMAAVQRLQHSSSSRRRWLAELHPLAWLLTR